MDTPSTFGEATPKGDPRSGPPPLTCTWTDSGLGAAWVRVAGELDLATCPDVDRALEDAGERAGLVVLDLRAVTFMDTNGMQCIIDATSRARREGRRIITVRGPAQVDRLFTLTDSTGAVEVLDLHAAEPPVQALLKAASQYARPVGS